MIDFSNATLLAYDHTPKFLGDSAFSYRVEKNYTIKGIIDNLLNTNGVEQTISGVNSFISSAQDFQSIVLCGVDMGSGRVESISFADGNWVNRADYSAKITIYETGNLSNMLGPYYSGIKDTLTDPANGIDLVESLGESFSFTVGESNNYSFSHSVDLKLISGGLNSTNCAKSIASGFLKNLIPFGFIDSQYSGFYSRPSKRYFTESYDLINGKYSFSEKFSTEGSNPLYGFSRSHTLAVDKGGLTSVSEYGEINGIVDPVYTSALSGLAAESVNSYSRCSAFYSSFNTEDSPTYALIDKIMDKSVDVDKFKGTISYIHKYNNDDYRTNLYIIDRGSSVELNSDFVTYTTNVYGKIVGMGQVGSQAKMDNAKIGYAAAPITADGVLIDKKVTYADYRGEINYSYSYNASPDYSSGDLLKSNIQTSITPRQKEYNDSYVGCKTISVAFLQDSLRTISVTETLTYRNPISVVSAVPVVAENAGIIPGDESYSFSYPKNVLSHKYSYMGG